MAAIFFPCFEPYVRPFGMVRTVGIMLCFHTHGRMFGVTIAMLTCKGCVKKVTCVNLYARFVGKYL